MQHQADVTYPLTARPLIKTSALTNVTAPPAASPLTQTDSHLAQVSGALTLIILLILLIAWLVRRFGLLTPPGKSESLKIRASLTLGTKEKLLLIDVENARLLLGVTSQRITCLHRLPAADNPPDDNRAARQATGFARLFHTQLNRQERQ